MPRHGSDSEDSYRSRCRRKKAKKKTRRSSSSSVSTRSSSSEKPKQYRRSHSRDRSKRHHHKSSHSKRSRRRRSSSSSNSRSRSRKHSSRVKERPRRSSSRSRSRGRSSKSTFKDSQSSSPRKGKIKEFVHKKERELEGNAKKVSEEEILREKLEAALKAAAIADAQLRQKGLLPESTQKSQVTSVEQQLKRAQLIEEINSESFTQKEFLSSRSWGNKGAKAPAESLSTDAVQTEGSDCLPSVDNWKTNPEKLVHPSWFEDPEEMMNRWRRKLSELRSGKYNGNDGIKKEL